MKALQIRMIQLSPFNYACAFLPLGEISERGIAIIVVVRPSVRGQNSWGGFLSPWMVLEIIFLCFPEGWNISWGPFFHFWKKVIFWRFLGLITRFGTENTIF